MSTFDAGSPGSGGSCSGAVSPDGALGPCGCQETVNGQTYAFNCDPSTASCTCTTNGAVTKTFADTSNVCGSQGVGLNGATLFGQCGYPQQ